MLPETFIVSIFRQVIRKIALFELAGHYYTDACDYKTVMEQIIETVHFHTLAVELSARLLQTGILEPEEVRDRRLCIRYGNLL